MFSTSCMMTRTKRYAYYKNGKHRNHKKTLTQSAYMYFISFIIHLKCQLEFKQNCKTSLWSAAGGVE